MSNSEILNEEPSLSELIQLRARTDIDVPITWLLVALANNFLWTGVALQVWSGESTTVTLGILASLGFVASAATSYLVFTLLNRISEHSSRAIALFGRTITSLEQQTRLLDQQAQLSLNSAQESFYNIAREQHQRSAIVWSLLCLLPFAGWVFIILAQWRLSRDLARHERLESYVIEDLARTFGGVDAWNAQSRYSPTNRNDSLGVSFVILTSVEFILGLYIGLATSLIVIYLTLGAVGLLWMDFSIRDPASHFVYHSGVESELLRAIGDRNQSLGAA